MFKNMLLLAASLLVLPLSVFAADVTVEWTPPASEANLDGYRLYYGQTSKGSAQHPGQFTYDTVLDVGNKLVHIVTGLADTDQQWCFALTAYSDSPEVAPSDYSGETCIQLTKLGPPGNPKVIKIEFNR